MKSQFILKLSLIILLIIISKRSISTEIKSIKFKENNISSYCIENSKHDTTLVFKANIGKYPKYYGLKNVLDSIEFSVNKMLQGDIPYKVFISVNKIPQETYSIKNEIFTYKIILKKCEEQNRYWKFGIAGAFYLADTLITPYNDKEPAQPRVRMLLSDNAQNWSSIGVERLSPSEISKEDINKYIIERNMHIDSKNSSNRTESSQNDAFTDGHIFFTCWSDFGIIKNKALVSTSLVEVEYPNVIYCYSFVYQDESIESSYSKKIKVLQNKTSNSLAVNKSNNNIEKSKVNEVRNNSSLDAKFTIKNCTHCKGTGTMKVCKRCFGRGNFHCYICKGRQYTSDGKVCLDCSGQGLLLCYICDGRKYNIKCNHKIYVYFN